MKQFALIAVVLLGGCASSVPTLDSQAAISRIEKLKQGSYTPTVPTLQYVQPLNQASPCQLPFPANSSPRNIAWYGACRHGKADGIGLSAFDVEGKRVYEIDEYDAVDGEKVWWHYASDDKVLFTGRNDMQSMSGRTFSLNRTADGYYTFRNSYIVTDKQQGIGYQLLRDEITGAELKISSYATNSLALIEQDNNDPTEPLARSFQVKVAMQNLYELGQYQNGTVISVIDNVTYNGAPLVPYLQQQSQLVLSQVQQAMQNFETGKDKTESVHQQLCQDSNKNADLQFFCDTNPYAAYAGELQRSANQLQLVRQQKMAQLKLQQQAAIAQQQQNAIAMAQLNDSLAKLNESTRQTSQAMLQSTSQIPQPQIYTPSNTSSIYTCQSVSSWTYCRQQR